MAGRMRGIFSLKPQTRQLRRWMGWWGRTTVDLLFPPRCVYCDHDLPERDHDLLLCQPCRKKLGPEQCICCPRCGAAMACANPAADGCVLCRSAPLHFDTVVPLAGYWGDMRPAILRMKHASGDGLSKAMGDLLLLRRRKQLAALRADLVVPIPLHWTRRLTRGTNSPDILARRLSAGLGVVVAPKVLACSGNKSLQADLSPPERFRNIEGAFRVRKGYDLGGARVLVVDDVLTTGATCSEAAKMLKQAGAAHVAAAVVARTQMDPQSAGNDAHATED